MKVLGFTLLALALGCHHDNKATTTPVAAAEQPAPAPAQTPAATPYDVSQDQKMSHTLAMSGDLVKLCGIKRSESAANPKFGFDTDELTLDDRNVLEQLATCMTAGPLKNKAVTLIGRADPRGTQEYNLALGSRRATSVSEYLQRMGVGQAQLPQTTRGALDATGTNEATWANDRRVDLQLQRT